MKNHNVLIFLSDYSWCAKVAFLADIFIYVYHQIIPIGSRFQLFHATLHLTFLYYPRVSFLLKYNIEPKVS